MVEEEIKRPFPAYEGDENYIFISYAHKDRDRVFPEIKMFHEKGFPIWYDDGLTPGQEWDEEIAIALMKSSLLVVFISENSMASTNVQDEIKMALNRNIDIVPIYLEDTVLPPAFELRLSNKHSIFKHTLSNSDYTRDCFKAFMNADIPKIRNAEPPLKDKMDDERLTSEYLKEFEKLNTTTESIFELGKHKVLIILKDATNLTDWEDVKNRDDVVYVSEDLSGYTNLSEKYKGLKSLKAIVTPKISPKFSTLKFMFDGCQSLVDISALSAWNVSKAINFNSMFKGCESLADISPLKEWNVSRVTNFNSMFQGCESLLDASPLDGWKISQAKPVKMEHVFDGCSSINKYPAWYDESKSSGKAKKTKPSSKTPPKKDKMADERLTSEYLKEFEKLNTTTESIFELGKHKVLIILKDATNLTDWGDVKNRDDVVYVSEDLSGYTNLSEKYKGLKSLKAIVTPKISSKFSTMKFMFDGCQSLVDISALSAWNVSKAINFNSMFNGCESLADISPLKEWNVSRVTNFNSMFKGCSSLVDIGALGSWNVKKVTDMTWMFGGCSSLVDVGALGSWNVQNVTNMHYMFSGCSSLVDVGGLGSWDMKNVTDIGGMFKGCSSLVDVGGLGSWNVQNVTYMKVTFSSCSSLVDVGGLGSWNVQNVAYMNGMFQHCSSLVDLSPLSNWNISISAIKAGIFADCPAVKKYPSWDERSKSQATKKSTVKTSRNEQTDPSAQHVNSFSELLQAIKSGAKNIEIVSDFMFTKEITLTNDNLTINGNGHVLDAGYTNRFFTIKAKNIKFESLTFKNGFSDHNFRGYDESTRDMDCEYRGGAIYNTGSCSFKNCRFIDNRIGDKVWHDRSRTNVRVWYKTEGAAIYSNGTCILESCTFENNTDKATGRECSYYGVTFKENEETENLKSPKENKPENDKLSDERLTSEYLREFEKLNKTTESIFELGKHDVLIILKDGTNLTGWDDVKNKEDIIYVSENLTNHTSLEDKYKGLESLKAIVTSGLPDKITKLNSMFEGCSSLIDISSLGSWNTQNVTNMNAMFKHCSSLVDVGALGSWDTQNVTEMMWMFRGCSSLVDVDGLGSWDTQNVTYMTSMFGDCSSLVDLSALSNWNMSKADKWNIFEDCLSIKTYPSWDERSKSTTTKKTTVKTQATKQKDLPPKKDKTEDKRLTSKYLKEFERMNTTTESIFELGKHDVLIILKDGTNLTSWDDVKNKKDIIYVSEDLTNHTSLEYKYRGLNSLKAIVTSYLPEKITKLNSMFDGCSSLIDISCLGSWDTQNVTEMDGMFVNCSSLVDISCLGSWDTQNVTNMGWMFEGCSSLVDLSPLSNWNVSIADKEDMFEDCPSIKTYPSWDKRSKSDKTTATKKSDDNYQDTEPSNEILSKDNEIDYSKKDNNDDSSGGGFFGRIKKSFFR